MWFQSSEGSRGCANAGPEGKGKATQPGKYALLPRAGSVALTALGFRLQQPQPQPHEVLQAAK